MPLLERALSALTMHSELKDMTLDLQNPPKFAWLGHCENEHPGNRQQWLVGLLIRCDRGIVSECQHDLSMPL